MAKHVQPGENIYIAPGITGKKDGRDKLVITDGSSGERLHPEKNIEHKIKIFERQVNGWFLEPASTLLGKEDNGFVILMIATAYIEGVEQYRKGRSSDRRESRTFFKEGVKRIFGADFSDERLGCFYEELRCGLFHNGMTGPNIRIYSAYDGPIAFLDNNIIKINQNQFLKKVKEDFEEYLIELRGTEHSELINNFNSMYTFT